MKRCVANGGQKRECHAVTRCPCSKHHTAAHTRQYLGTGARWSWSRDWGRGGEFYAHGQMERWHTCSDVKMGPKLDDARFRADAGHGRGRHIDKMSGESILAPLPLRGTHTSLRAAVGCQYAWSTPLCASPRRRHESTITHMSANRRHVDGHAGMQHSTMPCPNDFQQLPTATSGSLHLPHRTCTRASGPHNTHTPVSHRALTDRRRTSTVDGGVGYTIPTSGRRVMHVRHQRQQVGVGAPPVRGQPAQVHLGRIALRNRAVTLWLPQQRIRPRWRVKVQRHGALLHSMAGRDGREPIAVLLWPRIRRQPVRHHASAAGLVVACEQIVAPPLDGGLQAGHVLLRLRSAKVLTCQPAHATHGMESHRGSGMTAWPPSAVTPAPPWPDAARAFNQDFNSSARSQECATDSRDTPPHSKILAPPQRSGVTARLSAYPG